ncbi:hypothetical protein GFB56_18880 [Ensifer sp. T173]|uniref:Uncharacterized protein n=1 Tax=Ensifer canadensis TaxID=555315 RepID=A0AAW4FN33_9HYPH|nr:hypothetical protein [Ensifer canadensis]KQW34872.1 hypothetical protein ASD02_16715 [Ensifer sp. Root1252]KQW55633.1 hypothetical protein ASD03_18940 [Ensifer sp. Root127]KQY76965.1 hypothetical protein ASD52_23490 [Ensifer sp. Root142]KRC57196.1 hypothetical protein ASE32_20030 [Ensifer sp. Root231]KRC87691.1 hypothetical protein ASE47_14185 [Ensifer sp. Root258]
MNDAETTRVLGDGSFSVAKKILVIYKLQWLTKTVRMPTTFLGEAELLKNSLDDEALQSNFDAS